MTADPKRESESTVLRVSWDDLDVRPDGWTFYEDRPFDGFACEFTDDGRVREETQFQHGAQTGVSREYDDHGRLCLEEHFRCGSRHGFLRSWHENGQLERESLYEFSVLMKERIWDENGQMTSDYVIDPQDRRLTVVESYRQAEVADSRTGSDS